MIAQLKFRQAPNSRPQTSIIQTRTV